MHARCVHRAPTNFHAPAATEATSADAPAPVVGGGGEAARRAGPTSSPALRAATSGSRPKEGIGKFHTDEGAGTGGRRERGPVGEG